MNELETLTLAVRALRSAREPFVVATVVRVEGSSYRRPGARLIIASGQRMAGSVSGGCLEADLVMRGFFRTERAPVVVRYDVRSDDDLREGFGLGCDGAVEVLLERGAVDPAEDDTFSALDRVLRHERPAVLATIFRADDPGTPFGTRVIVDPVVGLSASATEDHDPRVGAFANTACAERKTFVADLGDRHVLFEHVAPPPHLFVFGTGHDVPPLVALARQAGFRVSVCSQEERRANLERFGGVARVLSGPFADARAQLDEAWIPIAIVMGHHLERDRDALEVAMSSRAVYIGVLGPRSRTKRLLSLVRSASVTDPRVYAPAGLRLGGESPEVVALSIVAEACAVLHGRSGGHLRDHRGPIHDFAAKDRTK